LSAPPGNGSIIEGNLDEILPVLREMHEQPFGQGAARVSTLKYAIAFPPVLCPP
jgi:uncharacterized protein YqgV (UPF0045/DUF77 family)